MQAMTLLHPCSLCDERFKGKAATAYWAWFNPLGVRAAKKQWYDPICYMREIRDLIVMSNESKTYECFKCEQEITNGTGFATYINLYLPTRDPVEAIFVGCDVCTDELRALASKGSEDLPNRQSALREAPNAIADPWADVP